jgi:DNA-binding NarL/FixJ family response regulator
MAAAIRSFRVSAICVLATNSVLVRVTLPPVLLQPQADSPEEETSLKQPTIRVLVVDDFTPWCRLVRLLLEGYPEPLVISEASDGVQGVLQAQELQPNLVIMDLSLPKLDGIEAARQILQHSPDSRILFLSQESSSEVIQAALASGAKGFVIKAHAGAEFLSAVMAVLRGETFISKQRPTPKAE